MAYFTIKRAFLLPSFDLEVKEEEKIDKFLTFLEDSGVGEIINKYIKNETSLGGRPSYNYYRLFATFLYGFAFDRYTLRDLQDACKYDLRYIYLMEQERPSYTTFCDFINRVIHPNRDDIFALINTQIQKQTNVNLEDAFIDGTKYEANSNKYIFVWKPILFHKKLSLKVVNIIKEYNLIPNYKNNDELIKSSTIAYALTHLNKKENEFDKKTFIKLNKMLTALLEKVMEYEEKEAICGPDRKSYYKTDHDATAMALKADYYSKLGSNMRAAYNIQILVMSGYVFSYLVSQERSDIDTFTHILDYFVKLYGYYPKRVCADAGYGCYKNYEYLDKHHIENYVKYQTWEQNKSGKGPDCYRLNDDDTITCLNNNIGHIVKLEHRHQRRKDSLFYKIIGCNSCQWMPYCKRFMHDQSNDFKIFEVVRQFERYKQIAIENLCSIKGIELRVNRSIQVEGVFGIIKQNYGYTRTRRRGLEKVSTEMMLALLGLNIARLFRYFETGQNISQWKAPKNIEPEKFKPVSLKRIVKRAKKITQKMK